MDSRTGKAKQLFPLCHSQRRQFKSLCEPPNPRIIFSTNPFTSSPTPCHPIRISKPSQVALVSHLPSTTRQPDPDLQPPIQNQAGRLHPKPSTLNAKPPIQNQAGRLHPKPSTLNAKPPIQNQAGKLQSHNSSAVVNTEGGEVCKRTSFLHFAIGTARPGGDNFRRVIPQYQSKNLHGGSARNNATVRLLQAPTSHR